MDKKSFRDQINVYPPQIELINASPKFISVEREKKNFASLDSIHISRLIWFWGGGGFFPSYRIDGGSLDFNYAQSTQSWKFAQKKNEPIVCHLDKES